MKQFLSPVISSIDKFISNHYLKFWKDKSALMAYLVHGLFRDTKTTELNHVHPQQRITVDLLRQFIEYHLENGFIFISPGKILEGLDSDKKYMLLTFDDGYFNNYSSLPVLHEFKVPAVFFISSGHVEKNECFWWDIVYRERIKRNNPKDSVRKEISLLKRKKDFEIRQYITEHFGSKAFSPISDIDRPFTPAELSSFAEDPFVSIGNHTASHVILTNCSSEEIRSEISVAQNSLAKITGLPPVMIAYPNGNFSEEVLKISKEAGLKFGITTMHKKNYLPISLEGYDPFMLNRFTLLGSRNIKQQCDFFRSDFQLNDALKSFRKKRAYSGTTTFFDGSKAD